MGRISCLTIEEAIRKKGKELDHILFTLFDEFESCVKYSAENPRRECGGTYSWLLSLTKKEYENLGKPKIIAGRKILEKYGKPQMSEISLGFHYIE
jgi:hypothetical protein